MSGTKLEHSTGWLCLDCDRKLPTASEVLAHKEAHKRWLVVAGEVIVAAKVLVAGQGASIPGWERDLGALADAIDRFDAADPSRQTEGG